MHWRGTVEYSARQAYTESMGSASSQRLDATESFSTAVSTDLQDLGPASGASGQLSAQVAGTIDFRNDRQSYDTIGQCNRHDVEEYHGPYTGTLSNTELDVYYDGTYRLDLNAIVAGTHPMGTDTIDGCGVPQRGAVALQLPVPAARAHEP